MESCEQILKKHGTFHILRCIHCESSIFPGYFQRMQDIAMGSDISRLFQLSFPDLETTSGKSTLIVTLPWLS